ncbi:unnamed protein product [Ranitomeya imitator]|uniref:Uncharacterized protein n=1 Tax=Ranitomeya imitator TaxID=111125 RepID=A0ABN9LS54_9NEOB|nr:unnamed protein product [Ranitomeya imitator]
MSHWLHYATKKREECPGTFLLLLSTLVRTGFGCFYFKGLNFSDQRLVVRTEEREEYCVINKTTPYGSIVPCKGNATSTRINDTHVLLRTPNDTDDYFTMEFGRDNEPGKSAESYRADCPDPSPVPGKVKNPDGNFRVHLGISVPVGAVIGAVIIIVILIFACKKYRKKSQSPNSRNYASSSNDSSREDLMVDKHMDKKGQV